ncbi:MAG TPA: IS200/IS605 family transposase [Candidatus Syntrophosphaera sp.]|jgi:REP element-mobilizing transposase RayT|nr:IS200/IS605 family transposase [Candidatus Syntrophosphaera sp.]
MPHSYTSINIHYVFSPHDRTCFDSVDTRKHINNYIRGLCHNLGCVCLASFVMPDHVHLLLRIPAKMSVAEVAQKVKGNTSRHLNTMPERNGRFVWQEGYGAFSCSQSMLEVVGTYIRNQEEHHKRQNFQDEFLSLLQRHEISPEDS